MSAKEKIKQKLLTANAPRWSNGFSRAPEPRGTVVTFGFGGRIFGGPGSMEMKLWKTNFVDNEC